MRTLEDKYIDLLLNRCINFETSKSLLIYVDLNEHLEFAERVKEKANQMGIFDVSITSNDAYEIHEYLKNTDVSDIELQPCFDRSIWDEYAIKGGALLILGSALPGLMNDISPEKIQKMVTLRNLSRPFYCRSVLQYKFPWCIAMLPNEKWAKKVFPDEANAYEKLYLSIMKMCMIDKEDPILAWQQHIEKNNYYRDKLNDLEITRMHYKNSLGTDLYVEKPKDNIWVNIDKNDYYGNMMIANMPCYEIFTSPDYHKTNGIVYSSRPLIFNDVVINNFYINFKDGKVIDCRAEEGEDVLRSLIFDNENADMLGEIALVSYDSPISNTGMIFYDTLFDENASCHLALGHGFEKCFPGYENLTEEELFERGCNITSIHEDFMIGTSDLEIEADTKEGKVLIFKDGNFNI